MRLLSRWFGPPSREAFSELMRDAIRAAGDGRTYTYDADQFRLRPDGAGSVTIQLHNAYVEYCRATRRDRRAVLARFAGITRLSIDADDGPEPTFDALRPRLLPRVREAFYFAAFELNGRIDQATDPKPTDKPPTDWFIHRPLADGHLSLEVVIDLPDAVQSLRRSTAESWGVVFDDVLHAARDNLWRISNESFKQVRPGLFMSPWRDTHDASRLALHDLIWQLPVTGRHVAAIPNRNVLLVTGDADDENLIAMAGLVEQIMTEPRAMTATVFALDAATWRPFLPPALSPAHGPLRRIAMMSANHDYNHQADLLERLHAATGADVYVAKQELMRRGADGTNFTWTSWVESVTDALMPRAEQVVLGGLRDGKSHALGFADWDALMAVAGHRAELTVLYPPRWRVRSFPSPDELARLTLTAEPT